MSELDRQRAVRNIIENNHPDMESRFRAMIVSWGATHLDLLFDLLELEKTKLLNSEQASNARSIVSQLGVKAGHEDSPADIVSFPNF